MTPENIIGVLSLVNGLLVLLVGWLVRQQSKMADRIDRLTTQVTVLGHEINPAGGLSLSQRIAAAETAIAVFTAVKGTP